MHLRNQVSLKVEQLHIRGKTTPLTNLNPGGKKFGSMWLS